MPPSLPKEQILHGLPALEPNRELFAIVVLSLQSLHRTHQATQVDFDDSPALFSEVCDLLAAESMHKFGDKHVSSTSTRGSNLHGNSWSFSALYLDFLRVVHRQLHALCNQLREMRSRRFVGQLRKPDAPAFAYDLQGQFGQQIFGRPGAGTTDVGKMVDPLLAVVASYE